MNHRIIILLIGLFIFGNTGFAQKLKDKVIQIPYVTLPTKKLPVNYNTYSVNVRGGAFNFSTRDPFSTAQSIQMDGFKRLSGQGSDFGHLRIYATSSTPYIGVITPRSKTTKVKDKNGVERTVTTYWYEFPIQAFTSYQIVDPEGNVIASGKDIDNKNIVTRRTSIRSTASIGKYNREIEKERNKFTNTLINKMVTRVNTAIRNQLDFDNRKARENFYYIKGGPLEKQTQEIFNEAKIVWESRDASSSVIETNEMLMDVLKAWSELASRKPGDDNKLKRVYKAANYNMAISYFYLDDLEKARFYAQKVIDSEGKDKPSNQLLKRIEKLEKRMELHGIYTQHYVRDLSNAVGPVQVNAFEEEQEEIQENNNTLDGYILFNNNQINGQFVSTKGVEELIFGKDGNTNFVVTEGTTTKEYDLTETEISSFKIGERSFIKTMFSPSSKGKEEAQMHILEILYTADAIQLYKYYSSQGALADNDTEYAYQKANDRFPLSLFDTQFLLFDKGMSQYFQSCPELSKLCADGRYTMDEDSLLQAARVFAEVCN